MSEKCNVSGHGVYDILGNDGCPLCNQREPNGLLENKKQLEVKNADLKAKLDESQKEVERLKNKINEGSEDIFEEMARLKKPIIVPDETNADEANHKYGDRYGVDWEYGGKP